MMRLANRTRNEREAFLGDFLVDFDKSGRVEFIELAKSKQFQARFEGNCLHHSQPIAPPHGDCALLEQLEPYV